MPHRFASGSGLASQAMRARRVKTMYITTSTTLTESAMALVSATAADVVLTLPAAADVADEASMVKKVLGAHKVIIAAQGTDEIDGVASIEITTPMAAFSLFSDGTTWHVL